jgi:hypothetical protein
MISLRDYDMARQLTEERARVSIRNQQLQRKLRNASLAKGEHSRYQTVLSRIGDQLAAWQVYLSVWNSSPRTEDCCPNPTGS